MKEVIIYARAGQGAITTAQVLGSAMVKSGLFAYAFPYFGAARMGAPMNAFLRYDTKPIRLRSQITFADCAIVVDETLFASKSPAEQLKIDGIAIINSDKKFSSENGKKIFSVPAAKIAEEIVGKPLANTVLLGVYCFLTKDVSIDFLSEAMKERFKDKVAQMNISLARAGFDFAAKNFK